MKPQKYLDNLIEGLHIPNLFGRIKKSIRRVGLIALVTATIGIGSSLGAEKKPMRMPEISYKLLFASDRTGNFDVYVINPDGSGLVQLTDSLDDEFPIPSSDGKLIAYQRMIGKDSDIWRMKPDGSGKRKIVENPAFDGYPSWLPFLKLNQNKN